MKKTIAIVEGPNLNLLGKREPSVYGSVTSDELKANLVKKLSEKCELSFFQSNSEGDLVSYIQDCFTKNSCDGIVINAAAYTHTSVAIRDALLATNIPFVEVHLSNVHAREDFRHKSLLADKAKGVITGLGPIGYELAVIGLLEQL